jgi:ribonuclease D
MYRRKRKEELPPLNPHVEDQRWKKLSYFEKCNEVDKYYASCQQRTFVRRLPKSMDFYEMHCERNKNQLSVEPNQVAIMGWIMDYKTLFNGMTYQDPWKTDNRSRVPLINPSKDFNFNEMLADLMSQPIVAFDFEFGRDRGYLGEYAALAQFSTYYTDYVVDTISGIKRMKDLKPLMESDSIIKIGVGMANDLKVWQTNFDICPRACIDLQILDYHIRGSPKPKSMRSLTDICKQYVYMNGPINSKLTYADFTTRSLHDDLVEYARSDTHLPLRALNGMRRDLEKIPIDQWLEECKMELCKIRYKPYPSAEEVMDKLRIRYEVRDRFAKVYQWRDDFARKVDLVPDKIITVTEIHNRVIQSLKTSQRMSKPPTFGYKLTIYDLDAYQKALATPLRKLDDWGEPMEVESAKGAVYSAIVPSLGCSKPEASIRKSFVNNCPIDEDWEEVSDDEWDFNPGMPTSSTLSVTHPNLKVTCTVTSNQEEDQEDILEINAPQDKDLELPSNSIQPVFNVTFNNEQQQQRQFPIVCKSCWEQNPNHLASKCPDRQRMLRSEERKIQIKENQKRWSKMNPITVMGFKIKKMIRKQKNLIRKQVGALSMEGGGP